MSYDINFWKQGKRLRRKPATIYGKLCVGERVEGLADLPVDDVLARLREEFPDFDPNEEFPLVSLDDGSIEFGWSGQWFRFDLRGHVPGEVTNQIVKIMAGFGCPLYDPQVDERYDAGGGTKPGDPPDFAERLDLAPIAFDLADQLKRIAADEGIDPAETAQPAEVELDRVDAGAFADADWLDAETRAAEERGFHPVGEYEVRGMGVTLRAFHAEPNVFACLYELAPMELRWADIVAFHDDDTTSIWTSTMVAERDVPPWYTRDLQPGAAFADLDRLRADAPNDKAPREYSPDDFERVFCASYARETKWRREHRS